jgi:hypothetical protein
MPNRATNFRESIEENCSIDLNPEQFGEWVTFYPAGGGATRQLVASIETSAQPVGEQAGEHLLEEIFVMVASDRYAATGGIDQPRSGDAIQRQGETERYAWSGEVRAHEGGAWHLVFARRRQLASGGPHRRP